MQQSMQTEQTELFSMPNEILVEIFVNLEDTDLLRYLMFVKSLRP